MCAQSIQVPFYSLKNIKIKFNLSFGTFVSNNVFEWILFYFLTDYIGKTDNRDSLINCTDLSIHFHRRPMTHHINLKLLETEKEIDMLSAFYFMFCFFFFDLTQNLILIDCLIDIETRRML